MSSVQNKFCTLLIVPLQDNVILFFRLYIIIRYRTSKKEPIRSSGSRRSKNSPALQVLFLGYLFNLHSMSCFLFFQLADPIALSAAGRAENEGRLNVRTVLRDRTFPVEEIFKTKYLMT